MTVSTSARHGMKTMSQKAMQIKSAHRCAGDMASPTTIYPDSVLGSQSAIPRAEASMLRPTSSVILRLGLIRHEGELEYIHCACSWLADSFMQGESSSEG